MRFRTCRNSIGALLPPDFWIRFHPTGHEDAGADGIEVGARRREELDSGAPAKFGRVMGFHRAAPGHMEVIYHPLVRGDVEEALSYYRQICAPLADEFYAELSDLIKSSRR